jgi:hypothetical protein
VAALFGNDVDGVGIAGVGGDGVAEVAGKPLRDLDPILAAVIASISAGRTPRFAGLQVDPPSSLR